MQWAVTVLLGCGIAAVALGGCESVIGLDELRFDSDGGTAGTGGTGGTAGTGGLAGGGTGGGMAGTGGGGEAGSGGQAGGGGQNCGGEPGDPIWSGDFGDAKDEYTWGLAVDSEGNVLVGGHWKPTDNPGLDLGCGALAYESSNNQFDSYLGKAASAGGACQWSTTIRGGTGWSQQLLWNAAVDSAGNVVVVGEFTEQIDFDGDGNADAYAIGGVDTFVASYASADGALRWWQTFGSQNAEVAAYGVTVDGDDNPVVVGRFHGNSVDFGGDAWLEPEGSDIFVVRVASADGDPLASVNLGGPGNQMGSYVAVDGTGKVVVVGQDQDGAADFGDIFVASVAPDLESVNWEKLFGDDDGYSQWGMDVDTLGGGDVIVAGRFFEELSLGTTDLIAAGNKSAFAGRLNASNGSEVWALNWGDVGGGAAVASMAVDGCDRIVVAGSFFGELDFGGSTDPIDSGHLEAQDAFLAKLDADGVGLWAYGFGDDQPGFLQAGQGAKRVATNADGNIAVAGSFFGTIDLGGGEIECATCDMNNMWDEFVGAFTK